MEHPMAGTRNGIPAGDTTAHQQSSPAAEGTELGKWGTVKLLR